MSGGGGGDGNKACGNINVGNDVGVLGVLGWVGGLLFYIFGYFLFVIVESNLCIMVNGFSIGIVFLFSSTFLSDLLPFFLSSLPFS